MLKFCQSLFEILHTTLCILLVYKLTVTGFGHEDAVLTLDWYVLHFGIVFPHNLIFHMAIFVGALR